jgi:hypothetical protein
MFNSLFGFPVHINPNLSGQSLQMSSGMAAQNAYNQNQAMSGQHAANMLAQQQAAYSAAQLGQLGQLQHRYMIDGRSMNFDQFLEELCPDPDDPMRSFLILKYKDTK